MEVLGQVVLVVCMLVAWAAGLYGYEKRQVKRDRRRAGSPSRETSVTGGRSLST
jgi:hypothetical protein